MACRGSRLASLAGIVSVVMVLVTPARGAVTREEVENAIKRVETEVRRAKRARCRKLHTFWSAVKAGIETQSQG